MLATGRERRGSRGNYPGRARSPAGAHGLRRGTCSRADSAQKLGALGLAALNEFAPTAQASRRRSASGSRWSDRFAETVRARSSRSCSASRWRTSASISRTATATVPTPKKTATHNPPREQVAAGWRPHAAALHRHPHQADVERAASAQPAHARSLRHRARAAPRAAAGQLRGDGAEDHAPRPGHRASPAPVRRSSGGSD